MTDRWIVSGYEFAQHPSLSLAQAEAARLAEKCKKPFRVYRIKDTLTAGETARKITALEARIAQMQESQEEPKAPAFDPEAEKCEGGVKLPWGPCPKCGATSDDYCPYAQGIEAEGRDAASRLGAEHESPTPRSGDAP